MLIPVICTVPDQFLELGKKYYLETRTLDYYYYLSYKTFVAEIYDYDYSDRFVCKSELNNFMNMLK